MSKEYKDLVVGLDIGTSRVTCLVAETRPEGELSVVALGQQLTNGALKRGVVVNIEATVDAISKAVREAESMAGCTIREVYTGITGTHIKSYTANGMVAINKGKEVTPYDVERVLEVARAISIPAEQGILHILPQEFIIDGQGGIREPIGMSGAKLEVKAYIVTDAISAAQNVVKCVRRCGLEAFDLILQPLASSFAVLTEDEKELGVCMIDIGGGTTDVAVFTQGVIRHIAVISEAGDFVTNDIAMGLHTPTARAEEIKIRHGVATHALVSPDETITIPGLGERPPRTLPLQGLTKIIEPRMTEIFESVLNELRRSGYEELLSSGVVLTGGSALMTGMVELADDIFHKPVRVGMPQCAGGGEVICRPQYSAAMGLVIEGALQRRRGVQARDTRGVKRVFSWVKSWF
ncbi:MAG: cell division protein FtsA [Azoarcus sp.]|jgi:cell division protein FtsA|nr:cell division protein FtsA [Azoarcus sp.]